MEFARIAAPLGYLCAFLAAVVVGRLAVLEDTGLALFWPAAGVAALWMLQGTTKRQIVLDGVLLFTSTALVFMLLGKGPAASLLFGAANLVQGLVVRVLRARRRRLPLTGPLTPGLTSTGDLLELSAAATVAALLSAPFGVAAALVMNDQVSGLTVVGWVVRNACGAFVVVAVVLTITAAYRDRSHGSLLTAERRRFAAPELFTAVTVTLLPAVFMFGSGEKLARPGGAAGRAHLRRGGRLQVQGGAVRGRKARRYPRPLADDQGRAGRGARAPLGARDRPGARLN